MTYEDYQMLLCAMSVLLHPGKDVHWYYYHCPWFETISLGSVNRCFAKAEKMGYIEGKGDEADNGIKYHIAPYGKQVIAQAIMSLSPLNQKK